jgi:hypothetical protein
MRGRRKYNAFLYSLFVFTGLFGMVVIFRPDAEIIAAAPAIGAGKTSIGGAFHIGNALTHKWSGKNGRVENEKEDENEK